MYPYGEAYDPEESGKEAKPGEYVSVYIFLQNEDAVANARWQLTWVNDKDSKRDVTFGESHVLPCSLLPPSGMVRRALPGGTCHVFSRHLYSRQT